MSEMRYQFLPNCSPDEADIFVLPVPWEATVCYKGGTAEAPAAILRASEQLEYFEEDLGWSPMLHMRMHIAQAAAALPGETEADYHARLAQLGAQIPNDKLFIALGGEHSITPSLLAGRMPEPGWVVLLDAHADLRSSYKGSTYSHASPMWRVREQGHRILMIGVRSLFESEAQRIAEDEGIECFRDRALRTEAAWSRVLQRLRALQGPVWLSIDMDVMNPALVPGVGTPQPGGLDWHRTLDVIETLCANSGIDLRGMDLVELVPEPSHVSEITAAKLMQKLISHWGSAKGYAQRPSSGAQAELEYE